jgi:hypothetical protein
MSTKIDDLPGPIPEHIREDLTQIQNEIPQPPPVIVNDNQSNIKADIKKKVQFKDDKQVNDNKVTESKNVFSFIQSQITEENLLLLIVLMIASRAEIDRYMIQLPLIGQPLLNSNILLTIAKAIIILICYIAFKTFILSQIN